VRAYFLVEGRRTEPKVYKRWIPYLIPHLYEIQGYSDNNTDSFFIRGGVKNTPSLYKRIRNSILESNDGNYDFFIICYDSEDSSVESKTSEINEILIELSKEHVELDNKINFRILIQHKCIETWFLGNRRVISRQPQSLDLRRYINHYDVYIDDPELMSRPNNDRFNSDPQFHKEYLKRIFEERGINYNKNKPRFVCERHYLNEIIIRVQDTNHLQSFRNLLALCNQITERI